MYLVSFAVLLLCDQVLGLILGLCLMVAGNKTLKLAVEALAFRTFHEQVINGAQPVIFCFQGLSYLIIIIVSKLIDCHSHLSS